MDIKGIIFDKDGTLIDFEKTWIGITKSVAEKILKRCGLSTELVPKLLASVGINGSVVDIDGSLCKGTYDDIANDLTNILTSHGADKDIDIKKMTKEAFHSSLSDGKAVPVCDNLYEVLKELKDRGIKIAVVTTDDSVSTEKCLKEIGVYDLFDRLYPDDGQFPTKPDPYYIKKFCSDFGFGTDEIMMVGDTYTDADFAKNGNVFFTGVAKSEINKEKLGKKADALLNDVSEIFSVIDR